MQPIPVSGLPESIDVLVVGYGPVGATLAALLGRYGIRTLVIDKATDILLMPRAIALDNEALRILQMAGLSDHSFARVGIQQVKMHCPLLGEYGRMNTAGTIDGHPKLITFYQPELERRLREQVEKQTSVTVACGYELVDLHQSESEVVATVQDRHAQRRRIVARFLVGADGASSKVRHLIKQVFEGKTYTQDWLIVDAKRQGAHAFDHVEFICDPVRPAVHMPAPEGCERWEFMLQPGESREEMERPEKLAALLSPWGGTDSLTVQRHAVYRFHARCCQRFQQHRVFLAGDAAHITPPFVGQGLVAGLRDAANLAWKLAWVARGRARPTILESYSRERQPHAKKMIDLARHMGQMVMPQNHARAALFHGALRALRCIPGIRGYVDDLGVKPVNAFRRGLIIPGNGGAALRRGAQIPQSFVRQGDSIALSDNVLGEGFVLVGFGVDPQAALDQDLLVRWLAIGGRCLHMGMRTQTPTSVTPFVEALCNDFVFGPPQGWVAVVRPDRVIMHDAAPGDANLMISQCLALLA